MDSSSFMYPEDQILYFVSFSKYAWSRMKKLKLGM